MPIQELIESIVVGSEETRVRDPVQDLARARDEGEPDQRAGRERACDQDERHRVRRVLLEVRRRQRSAKSFGGGSSHCGSRKLNGPRPHTGSSCKRGWDLTPAWRNRF